MSEERIQKPETKTCESCGKDFSCGANVAECWCFGVDLNKETLAKLQEDFESCLCRDCLVKTMNKASVSGES